MDTNISNPTLEAATRLNEIGTPAFGCNEKRPTCSSWIPYRSRTASRLELHNMWIDKKAQQVAIPCGGLMDILCIDIDTKHDQQGDLFDRLWQLIEPFFSDDAWPVIESTPSGGYHIVFRCEGKVPGNQKLALSKSGCTIETRGDGGYFVCSPSPGYFLLSGSFECMPVLSESTVSEVIQICKTLTEIEKADDAKKLVSPKERYEYKQSPWEEYNQSGDHPSLEVLQSHGWEITRRDSKQVYLKRPHSDNNWGATYHLEKHVFYPFTSSTEFDPNKGYSPTAVYAILEHGGDYSAAAKSLHSQGYGQRWSTQEANGIRKASELFRQGACLEDIERMLTAELLIPDEELSSILDCAKTLEDHVFTFWYRDKKEQIRIDDRKLLRLCSDTLYYKMYGQTFYDRCKDLIRINPTMRTVSRQSIDCLKKAVDEWVVENGEGDETEVLLALMAVSRERWTNVMDRLEVMTANNVVRLRDTADTCYFMYQDGVAVITKDGYERLSYSDLPQDVFVWENSILERCMPRRETISDIRDLNRSDAFLFIKRICGIGASLDQLSADDLSIAHPDKWLRLRSALSTIGYFLSTFKDRNLAKAPFLCEDTDDEADGGGTGKGLLIQMISKMRRVLLIPGREWMKVNAFRWASVTPETDVVFIDDLPPRFQFGSMYNVVTEGITVNRKYQDEYFLPYESSPKIGFTTNYDPPGEGDHAERRRTRFPFAKYFSKNHTPHDEFGRHLFYGWSDEDWALFDIVMFQTVQLFLSSSLIEVPETANMRTKKLKLKYGADFISWAEQVIVEGDWRSLGNSTLDNFVLVKDLQDAYINETDDDGPLSKARSFGKALRTFCTEYGILFESRKRTGSMHKGSIEISFNVK